MDQPRVRFNEVSVKVTVDLNGQNFPKNCFFVQCIVKGGDLKFEEKMNLKSLKDREIVRKICFKEDFMSSARCYNLIILGRSAPC